MGVQVPVPVAVDVVLCALITTLSLSRLHFIYVKKLQFIHSVNGDGSKTASEYMSE